MYKLYFRVLIIVVCFSILAYGQGNTFDKIRYNGGTLATKVSPKDWDNQLTVTSDQIILTLKDRQTIKINPARVSGLSYGQEAHRRVGTMVALGILLAPLALFGLFHKTRQHFVGIEFTTADGKKSALLLQAHKDNYKAVLTALRGATGAGIAVAEEDRKYVPVGTEVITVPPSDKEASESTSQQPAAQKNEETLNSNDVEEKTAPSINPATKDYTIIKIGMTADEVRRIMGEPSKTSKTETEQGIFTTWEYQIESEIVRVMFKQTKVKSITVE